MDRFVVVGSGCSGAVPLCNHLIKGINEDTTGRTNNAKESDPEILVTNTISPATVSSPTIRHLLSGSEGPCSSDGRDSSQGDALLALKITDIDAIKCDVWKSQAHELAPTFELYSRNRLYEFQARTRCRCRLILNGGAEFEPERRNNVSCLIQKADADGNFANILVDVGKTFRDACLKVLLPLGVTTLDDIILTHGHSDAMGGMDDLREFQTYSVAPIDNSLRHICHRPLSITCMEETAAEVLNKFDYCFESDSWVKRPDGSILMPSRWPAYTIDTIEQYLSKDDLSWHESQSQEHDNGEAMKQSAIRTGEKTHRFTNGTQLKTRFYPVFHGGSYISMGFGFGSNKDKVLYLSDIKAIASPLLQRICLDGPWNLLVVDCIAPIKQHYSHATLYEVLHWTRVINPQRVLLVGMTCVFPPVETKELLDEWILELRKWETTTGRGFSGFGEDEMSVLQEMDLAHDGLVIPVDL